MHNSLSEDKYQILLTEILSKWKKDTELLAFHNYFLKQWVNSSFNHWQIFLAPIGFAHTNSPIECYNKIIKEDFTKRLKHNIKSCIEI